MLLKAAVIRRSGPAEWPVLAGEVQEELERAREIQKARQRFVRQFGRFISPHAR